jgi:hypothetical protein
MMTWTDEKVAMLCWLNANDYLVELKDGKLWFLDTDMSGKSGQTGVGPWLDVTTLFHSWFDSQSGKLEDKLSDFAYDHYCTQCESYYDQDDIKTVDHLDWDERLCCDCLQELAESYEDPYTLRGLRRDDF